MQRFENILVAVDPAQEGFSLDGSLPPEPASALEHVVWVQEQSGARLTLLAAVEEAGQVDDAKAMLAATAGRVLEGVEHETKVVIGRAQIEIVRAVVDAGHDLVVVAARRHSLLRRNIVGTTSIRLVRVCPCPVWVAPRVFPHRPMSVLSAIGFHPGITPLILELSSSMVVVTEGTWNVMHCVEYPEEGGMRLRDETHDAIHDYRRRTREVDWERLHKETDPLAEKLGVEPRFWLAEGYPDEQIDLAVRELDIDLLVMGTVGRSGVPGFIIGNTAERIIQSVECSVLAVKPEGFQTPLDLS